MKKRLQKLQPNLTRAATMRKCIAVLCWITLGTNALADESILEKQEIRAQLSPHRYTTLGSELNAKISHITVKEGEQFKKGQPLVRFDCALQAAQLQRAKAVSVLADKTYTANQRLWELNSIGQLELETAKAEVEKSRADVKLIEKTLQKCTILAPFSGRVAEQKIRDQQFAQAGQPILEIIDDGDLELEFIVPSHWLSWLKTGHQFNVKIDETNKQYPAKINRLGARVDPISQSIKVAAVIEGIYPELIAGMSGRIELKNKSNTISQGARYDKTASST